jgi:hypothetical protein
MKDAASVITQTTLKIADKLAEDMEVSIPRMYEILSKDNPYPKAKRLIRAIGRHNPAGIRLIKADMDAMFADLIEPTRLSAVTVKEVHKEAFDAIDAMLCDKPAADQKRELRELVAVAEQKIEAIDRLEERRAS